MKTNDSKIKI